MKIKQDVTTEQLLDFLKMNYPNYSFKIMNESLARRTRDKKIIVVRVSSSKGFMLNILKKSSELGYERFAPSFWLRLFFFNGILGELFHSIINKNSKPIIEEMTEIIYKKFGE